MEWTPSRNVSPGEQIPVITDALNPVLRTMRWGLVPYWAKDPAIGYKTINARAETVAEKPSFRAAFARRRCLIPASGFYEWLQAGARKQPYKFTLTDHKMFAFAGLWEHWQDQHGNELTTCAIITTTPNEVVGPIHDRMPVILDKDSRRAWLEDRPLPELQSLLKAYPAEKMNPPEAVDSAVFR